MQLSAKQSMKMNGSVWHPCHNLYCAGGLKLLSRYGWFIIHGQSKHIAE